MKARSLLSGLVTLALVAAACGSGDETGPVDAPDPVKPFAVAARATPAATADPTLAGGAIAEFGHDLFVATAAGVDPGANLVLSPLSVALALGLAQPGASGDAVAQFADLLGIDDPDAWHASANALEQDLEGRTVAAPPAMPGEQQDPGELTMRIANAAFLRPGYPFLPAYLDAIGTNYGAALYPADFSDPDAAAELINAFIAEQTDGHITDLLSPDAIDPEATVAALVNALLLYASWTSPFQEDRTAEGDFTRADGSTVTVPLMHGGSDRAVRGDGFVAASKTLVGNLRVEFVLPDEGRFDEIAAAPGAAFAALAGFGHGAELVVPRFETRVNTELSEPLKALGLVAPFATGSLLGVADDPRTQISGVLHETWLKFDEEGVEAAAATIVMMIATSMPVDTPPPVILDRPFLLRIADSVSGVTLFEGRIMDPTA